MKIFLSAIDPYTLDELKRTKSEMLWNLLSYYQIRGKGKGRIDLFQETLRCSREMLIDSGAHSFQKGKKVDWEAYTREYADFIKKYDDPKILGYFEMDVDNIIGYDNVLRLRRILTAVSPKIIPVWHKNRGLDDFKVMCREYSGRIVAITGFKDEDIRDSQYHLFVKYAHDCGCKIHGLGMTRTKVLDKVPFDFTDSASWKLSTTYGKVRGFDKRIAKGLDTKKDWCKIWAHSYREFVKMQKHYHLKYHKLHND